MPNGKVRFMCELPNALYQRLRERAYIQHISMAEIARQAIRQALEETEGEEEGE